MQLFVKTMTGKTITIEVDRNSTILDMKKAINAKDGIPVKFQRIIVAGKQCEDHRLVADYEFQKYATIHLVLRNIRPEVDFSSHQFYITVHNFYDEPGKNNNFKQMRGKTSQFQYVFDIEVMLRKGFSMDDIFSRAIEVRNLRTKKNSQHEDFHNDMQAINGKAECSISIIAIDKNQRIISGEASSILGHNFKYMETLMGRYDYYSDSTLSIPYKLVASVQPDNTVFIPRALDRRVEVEICGPFRQQVYQHIMANNFVNRESLQTEFQAVINENEEEIEVDDVKKSARQATYMNNLTYQLIATLDLLDYSAEEVLEMEDAGILDKLFNNQPINKEACQTYGMDGTNLLLANAIRNNSPAWVLVMSNIRESIDANEITDDELKEEVAQFAEKMVKLVIESYRVGTYEITFEKIKNLYLNQLLTENAIGKVEVAEIVNDQVANNENHVDEAYNAQETLAEELYTAGIIEFLQDLRSNYDSRNTRGTFFSKSPSIKHAALTRLIEGLEGQHVNILDDDIDRVYRKDNIGSTIRRMVKDGYASMALGREITTVTEFIHAVQDKVNQNINAK